MSKKNEATAPSTTENTALTPPALRQESALAIPADIASGNWGAIESMETTDVLVPKIFHQQAMSKFVADGSARPGDFCDSLTGEVLAKKEDKLEVIVFGLYKTMIVSQLDAMSNKYKLKEIAVINHSNAKAWAGKGISESNESGDYKYNLCYNFYCLLPDRITELPYILSLGSTKTRAAKKLNAMILKLSQLKKPGASVVFELKSVPEKNDQGSWFGLEVAQGRNSSAVELMAAHAWYTKSQSETIVAAEDSEPSVDASMAEENIPF